MSYCLPSAEAQDLLKAVADGSFDPHEYADQPDTDARQAYLSKFVGEANAKDVNTLMESKLLLKDQQAGMITAIKKLTGLSDPLRREYTQKVANMSRFLDPDEEKMFLQDLAESKLGVRPTAEEATKIAQLAQKVQALRNEPTTNLSGVSDGYLKAATDMKAYVDSLKPVSATDSILGNAGIIARNNLLLNPSTPIKTTLSQIINTGMDYVTRRLAVGSIRSLSSDLATRASQEAWKTFKNTGLNTAAMENIDDTGRLGEGKNFDVPQGMDAKNPVVRTVEKGVRAVAKLSNKVAIDWEHNITFTKFYQKAFFDMTNILSSNIAKTEGLSGADAKTRSDEILTDAAKIKPTTDVGATVRQQAQMQAARVTSTNSTLIARMALGVKDALNRAVPRLGDILMPIAKIPANIIWNGIENAGVGIPLGVKDIFEGRAKIQSTDLSTRYEGMAQYSKGLQTVARTVGTISAAAYFSSQLQKNDFRTDEYGNHFVKIGNVWINMEYIAAVSPALAGMMSVKENEKKNQPIDQSAGEYTAGALEGLKSAPGIDELSQFVTALTNPNYAKGIKAYASTFFSSRGEPAFIKNLQGNRPIQNLFFGATGVETTQQVSQDRVAAAQKAAQKKAQ